MSHWITDSQDEQTFEEIFRDADQINIPIFQRKYVWKTKQFSELEQDISLIHEGIEESQFLGAIVAYERERNRSAVGRLKSIDLVDGQQRILTLYIFIMAIAERLAYVDKRDAADVVNEYLLLTKRRGLEINTRVIPSFNDRSQFRLLWDRINTPKLLQKELQDNPPLPPQPSGNESGHLYKQYKRIESYLRKNEPKYVEGKIEFLLNHLKTITQKFSFVHLKLTDASVATKIFERLNFRGVKVGILDLVRNEVFSRVSSTEALNIFSNHWQPFEDDFTGNAESFFFPYSLIIDNSVTKSELFTNLRREWDKLNAIEIIQHMIPYQTVYNAIDVDGKLDGFENVSQILNNLVRLGTPSVVYPFIMKLLYDMQKGLVAEKDAFQILKAIESFLVQRAIVGFEPTGLHALFKNLYNELDEIDVENFISKVSSKPTIQWPKLDSVKESVDTRALANTKICKYLLVEFDRSLPGDNPTSAPTIEHIMPQSYDKDSIWAKDFDKDTREEKLHTLANLIPLSQPLNSSVKTKPYKNKRKRYLAESMFIGPRHLAQSYDEWNPTTLSKRSKFFQKWVCERWPHNPLK